MKLFQFLLFGLLFFSIPEFSKGQNLKENELVVIQGEKFILHQVRTGETVYSISRYFKTESTVLLKYNPSISAGLSIGEILKIPYNENIILSEIPDLKKGDPTGFASHTVESNGETAYSISKRYGITVEEIYAYNPTVQRLRRGMVIKIPRWDLATKPESGSDQQSRSDVSAQHQTEMLEHTVVSGETLYSISKKYQVSEEELKAINPELKFAFRSGSVIRIPVHATKEAPENIHAEMIFETNKTKGKGAGFETNGNIPENCFPENRIGSSGKTVIALFLPLFLEANEQLNKDFMTEKMDVVDIEQPIGQLTTDTIIENEKPVRLLKQFHGNSENFLQFYEGVLLAVDSMQKAGMNMVLNVFDTKDNPETVRKIKNSQSFSETDLIIGPVYENVQKEVTQISIQYQIPMISPFTPKSEILDSNPWFFQINPTRGYLAEATAELIANKYSNSNFIVVRTSSYPGAQENQLVELIRRKLSRQANPGDGKFTEYDFRKGRSHGLREILVPDKENVVFIPSSDEGELSVAISNINNLAVDIPITLIGAGNYQQRYPSIEIAHFHNLQMKYINPYWIDYKKPETIGYIDKFIDNFGTEPNSFGVQGFDAAWYFLNVLHIYGKDFESCLPFLNVNLVQGNYYFKRVSQSGGYMNHGASVVSYTKNYEVERQEIMGQPDFEGAK